ncbi:TlpA family protein disulfide reductase [Tundrisphaera lichenicola]|uniref:TlpA family protein disulfide reductase n=1 Tax=Tundrisphaera lichenicola TaxID=2029860 RepID=UPI003EBCB572
MNAIARTALLGLLTLGIAASLAPAVEKPSPAGEVKLVPVKYDAMLARIAANKEAKLTIVDAWATWCGPCKDNFPHVVKMHEKYAEKGLVVISLSLDDPTSKKDVTEATKFLESQKAVFTNLLLDETQDDAFEKLDLTAIPAVFLYGPDGKEIRRFNLEDVNNQFTYDQVEQAVKDYLEGKPITGGSVK